MRISVTGKNRLVRRIHAREAIRRAGRTGDHTYFAVFSVGSDIMNVGTTFSVIRCATDKPWRWETFLRDAEWPRTSKPTTARILAIDVADVNRITHRIAASEQPRYFGIRDTSGPVALNAHRRADDSTSGILRWPVGKTS